MKESNREPKHLVLHQSVNNLEDVVSEYFGLISQIEINDGNIPKEIKDDVAKEPIPSLLTVLNTTSDRIDSVIERMRENLQQLKEMLF